MKMTIRQLLISIQQQTKDRFILYRLFDGLTWFWEWISSAIETTKRFSFSDTAFHTIREISSHFSTENSSVPLNYRFTIDTVTDYFQMKLDLLSIIIFSLQDHNTTALNYFCFYCYSRNPPPRHCCFSHNVVYSAGSKRDRKNYNRGIGEWIMSTSIKCAGDLTKEQRYKIANLW